MSTFIPFAVPDITQAEVDACATAVAGGWLTTGPNTAAFEKEFAEYLGDSTIEAVAVNSGTAGLHLALEAVGVGAGDEVLVPTLTFTATAEVVRYLGAHPVFVDSDPQTLNMNLHAARRACTPRTKAIIPVHYAGRAINPIELATFADDMGLAVVEDAAHALPAGAAGQLVGTGSSSATVFSFYATKTVTTGEGGMLVTRDKDIARRARVMRLHGISRDVFDRYTSKSPSWRYEVVAPGFKYNMPDMAAAIGRVQLRRAEEMWKKRTAVAEQYLAALGDLPLTLPAEVPPDDLHAWHLFVVQVREDAGLTRDAFIETMAGHKIGTSVHFIPLHEHPYWRERYQLRATDFPVADAAFQRIVSLPVFSSMTEEQVSQVIRSVRRTLT